MIDKMSRTESVPLESIDMGIQVVEVHPPDGGAIETVNGLLNLMRSGSHGAKQAWKALKVEAQVKTKSHRHKK